MDPELAGLALGAFMVLCHVFSAPRAGIFGWFLLWLLLLCLFVVFSHHLAGQMPAFAFLLDWGGLLINFVVFSFFRHPVPVSLFLNFFNFFFIVFISFFVGFMPL